MNENKPSVLITDPQWLTSQGLKMLIEESGTFAFGGTIDSLPALRTLLAHGAPSLLVADSGRFCCCDLDELKRIMDEHPHMHVMVMTNTLQRAELSSLSKMGIKNVILKTADAEEILLALDAAVKGRRYYSSELLDMLADMPVSKHQADEPAQLTHCEIEIVRLIGDGLTTKEIAERKHISFHTVMSHRKNIFRKLGINNASELVMYAVRAGLIDTIEYYI